MLKSPLLFFVIKNAVMLMPKAPLLFFWVENLVHVTRNQCHNAGLGFFISFSVFPPLFHASNTGICPTFLFYPSKATYNMITKSIFNTRSVNAELVVSFKL